MTTVSRLRLVWALALVVAAAGCKSEGEKAEESPPGDRVLKMVEGEPKVAKYIENVAAIAAAAAKKPELRPITSRPSDASKTDWIYEGYVPGTTAGWPPPVGTCVPFPIHRELLTIAVTKKVSASTQDWAVGGYAKDIEQLAQLTHVFVCRQDKAERGTVADTKQLFEGGFFEGECRAYDPWTKDYLGGFALKASIGEKVTTAKDDDTKKQEMLDFSLNQAIAAQARRKAFGKPGGSNDRPGFTCVWSEPSGR